jgi:metal-dependent amidase/aminoacylase/carboxypeptidase family protein
MKEAKNSLFNTWRISLRHLFHQYPELSFQEYSTQVKVIEILISLGIENKKIAGMRVDGIIN